MKILVNKVHLEVLLVPISTLLTMPLSMVLILVDSSRSWSWGSLASTCLTLTPIHLLMHLWWCGRWRGAQSRRLGRLNASTITSTRNSWLQCKWITTLKSSRTSWSRCMMLTTWHRLTTSRSRSTLVPTTCRCINSFHLPARNLLSLWKILGENIAVKSQSNAKKKRQISGSIHANLQHSYRIVTQMEIYFSPSTSKPRIVVNIYQFSKVSAERVKTNCSPGPG